MTNFYTEFNKFKYIVKIKSVIKGRHVSTERQTFEELEVNPEPENKIDKRAFRVHPIIPASYTYGHVPFSLSVAFHETCTLAEDVRVAYEIWCQPTGEDTACQPVRWRRGGGIQQNCIYKVHCGALLFEKLMYELEKIEAECEVDFVKEYSV